MRRLDEDIRYGDGRRASNDMFDEAPRRRTQGNGRYDDSRPRRMNPDWDYSDRGGNHRQHASQERREPQHGDNRRRPYDSRQVSPARREQTQQASRRRQPTKRRKRRFGPAIALFLILLLTFSTVAGLYYMLFMSTRRMSASTEEAAVSAQDTTNALPAAEYKLLYSSGSVKRQCYDAFYEDFSNGVIPNSMNPLSWPQLPVQSAGQESNLVGIAKSVMLDSPKLTAYTTGEVSLTFLGSRYLIESQSVADGENFSAEFKTIEDRLQSYKSQVDVEAGGNNEKFVLVAYRALCEAMEYESEAGNSHSNDIYGAISDHKAKCIGLSATMKALLDLRSIPNYIAYGTLNENGTGHAWNMVFIDDTWYVCDLTSGCLSIRDELQPGTEKRQTLDTNLAAMKSLLPNCMVAPATYEKTVTVDSQCVKLRQKYEALAAKVKGQNASTAHGANTPSGLVSDPMNVDQLADQQRQAKQREDEQRASDQERLAMAVAQRSPIGSLKYNSLMDDRMMLFYATVRSDLSIGKVIDPDNSETWFLSPVSISTNEECAALTSVAEQAMYDDPALSVTNGGGGWTMKYWALQVGEDMVSRYAIVSDISTNDPDVVSKIAATRQRAQEIASQAQAESGGDPEKYVYAAYRDISLNCAYADDVDDSFHHNDAYGAFFEGEAKCYGVSCAMKMVLDYTDIPNYVAFGMMNDIGHAWNVLWIDGEWKVCDLTTGSLMSQDDYAEGSLNRQILLSDVNPMDNYYQSCMIPADEFYESSGAVADEVCLRLQYDFVTTNHYDE